MQHNATQRNTTQLQHKTTQCNCNTTQRNATQHNAPHQPTTIATREWTEWKAEGSMPSGSFYQAAVFVEGHNLISFGGRDLESENYNDAKTGIYLFIFICCCS